MTPEERNQTGKYSDEYQDEYYTCAAIAMVVLFVLAAVLTVLGA